MRIRLIAIQVTYIIFRKTMFEYTEKNIYNSGIPESQTGSEKMEKESKIISKVITAEKLTDEEREIMTRAVKRIFGYRDEEWDAVLNPELMTEKLFRDCMEDSARIEDFETFTKLSDTFPEYCEELFAELEAECTGGDKGPARTLSEEINIGMEKLRHKLCEKNRTDVL